MVLSLECSGFEVKSSMLLRYQIECSMSYITSLCCDSCNIFSVVAGSDGWLLTVYRETHTNAVVLHNSEHVDLLVATCTNMIILQPLVTTSLCQSISTTRYHTTRTSTFMWNWHQHASDGLETSFIQPSALCFNLTGTLIVWDAAVGQVKSVSLSTAGLV